jgi:hypothetical protein
VRHGLSWHWWRSATDWLAPIEFREGKGLLEVDDCRSYWERDTPVIAGYDSNACSMGE